MKKLIAIILVVLSIVSLMSIGLSAFAENTEETKVYAVVYSKGGIPVMYEPAPTFRFDKPGMLTISNDTPLAVDYEFVCWQDENGQKYYPGDKIYVDHEIKLIPVFSKKTDNDPHVFRVIKTALDALIRVLGKALGFFTVMEDFNAD